MGPTGTYPVSLGVGFRSVASSVFTKRDAEEKQRDVQKSSRSTFLVACSEYSSLPASPIKDFLDVPDSKK